MVAMPEFKNEITAAIERSYRDRQQLRDWNSIPCSKIGEDCERSLWYSLRWTTPLVRHEGRMQRLFLTGHREEARLINDLRDIGVQVAEVDPQAGQQWRVSLRNGVLTGMVDGIAINVPGAEKTEHLVECKTLNEKSFTKLKREGVADSKPVHFAQMQVYMVGLGLTRALYISVNKNTDEIYTERVKFDPLAASALLAKAERIAFAPRPPEKHITYLCRFCQHFSTCGLKDYSRVNCRTCLHSTLGEDGMWKCALHKQTLSHETQKAGCASHLFIPDLVDGEQIDADPDSGTVTYQFASGRVYVDGLNEKIGSPEVVE